MMQHAWWRRGGSSIAIVVGVSIAWGLGLTVAPAVMDWLVPDPIVTRVEGPIDWFENVLLPVCVVLWLVIARRHAAHRGRMVLALLMALQLAFVFGEETDWGQTLGLRPVDGWRNVRMVLRDAGVLQRWDDALVPTGYLLFFMLVPLVPISRVQRWLERVAPVRAQIGDGIAIVLLPLALLTVSVLVRPQRSVELVQIGAYAVVTSVALRILRAPIPAPA